MNKQHWLFTVIDEFIDQSTKTEMILGALNLADQYRDTFRLNIIVRLNQCKKTCGNLIIFDEQAAIKFATSSINQIASTLPAFCTELATDDLQLKTQQERSIELLMNLFTSRCQSLKDYQCKNVFLSNVSYNKSYQTEMIRLTENQDLRKLFTAIKSLALEYHATFQSIEIIHTNGSSMSFVKMLKTHLGCCGIPIKDHTELVQHKSNLPTEILFIGDNELGIQERSSEHTPLKAAINSVRQRAKEAKESAFRCVPIIFEGTEFTSLPLDFQFYYRAVQLQAAPDVMLKYLQFIHLYLGVLLNLTQHEGYNLIWRELFKTLKIYELDELEDSEIKKSLLKLDHATFFAHTVNILVKVDKATTHSVTCIDSNQSEIYCNNLSSIVRLE